MLTKILLTIFVFGVVVPLVLGHVNTIWNEGIAMERQLSAQFLDNQNYLSEYVSGFYEQIDIANVKRDALNKILTDAVKGRYDRGGFQVNSAFFVALREAYPDLSSNLNIYDKIVEYIQAKRAGFRAVQSKLLDQMRVYDTWRQTGFLRRFFVSYLGFPTDNLEARVGDSVKTRHEARSQMLQIVLTPESRQAYETGTMSPLRVNR